MDKRVCIHGLWPDGLELYTQRYAVACSCVEIWVLLCYFGHSVRGTDSSLMRQMTLTSISAFIVQVYGAASAESNSNNTVAQILQGIHIYMGGVAIQQFFIFCFCAFAYEFWRRLLHQRKTGGNATYTDLNLKSGFTLLYALVVVLILISVSFPSITFLIFSGKPHLCL